MTKSVNDFIKTFAEQGYFHASSVYDASSCEMLANAIYDTREFGPSLFLSEAEFNAGPKSHYNTNPNPGRNILESFDDRLSFIENDDAMNAQLSTLLGKDFRWFYRKLVCRVPRSAIPDWVLRGIQQGPTTTLGAYIKPEYRDIAYYHDNELHQDIMDYARMPEEIKEHRLITMYVYLSDVTAEDAPTCIVPKSHHFGANPFPYDVRRIDNSDIWVYTDAEGKQMETTIKEVPTTTGSALIWHSCLLHGARPIADDTWRLGLRYMLACNKDCISTELDNINKNIEGPLYLEKDYTSGPKVGADGFVVLPKSDFARTYF